jgi:hypothetical protein
MFFILDDNNEPQEATVEELGGWMKDDRHVVKQDRLWPWFVSTIFLGIDHRYPSSAGSQEPVLFETMVFRGQHEVKCRRYCTRDEAMAGHQDMAVKYFMLRMFSVLGLIAGTAAILALVLIAL